MGYIGAATATPKLVGLLAQGAAAAGTPPAAGAESYDYRYTAPTVTLVFDPGSPLSATAASGENAAGAGRVAISDGSCSYDSRPVAGKVDFLDELLHLPDKPAGVVA